jgi:hypothetical protein
LLSAIKLNTPQGKGGFTMRYFLIIVAVVVAASSISWAEDNTIGKQAWIEHMQNALPKAFCEQKQYFRQCFRVSEQECLTTASTVTNMCLNKLKAQFPEVFYQPQDGSNWVGKVGECAGDAYEQSLLDKRINTEYCNDVKNWI